MLANVPIDDAVLYKTKVRSVVRYTISSDLCEPIR